MFSRLLAELIFYVKTRGTHAHLNYYHTIVGTIYYLSLMNYFQPRSSSGYLYYNRNIGSIVLSRDE